MSPRIATAVDPRRGGSIPFSPLRLGGLQGWWAADLSPTTLAAGMAAQFTAANLEYLSHAGNATLRGAVAGWWRCGWIYLDAINAQQIIMSCLSGNNGFQAEVTATNVLKLTGGTGAGTAAASHGTALAATTWYFWYAQYDGTNLGISLNAGALTTQALGAAYSPGANAWQLGADLTPANYWGGRMCGVYGGDGTLTSAQVTAIYNSGNGVTYDALRGLGIAPGFAYELNEPSLTRADQVAAATLTDNNTVTTSAGLILNAISQVNDLSGNGRHLVQATQAKKPVYRGPFSTYQAGWALDGVDDLFTADAIGTALTGEDIPFTVVTVFSPTATTANNDMWSLGSSASSNQYVLHRMDAGTVYGTQVRDDTGLAGGTKSWSGTLTSTAALHASVVMTTGTLGNAFVDGTITGAADADVNVGTLTLNQFGVGALWRQTASQFFTGTIKEVMVFNRVLSSNERAQVQRYLSHRWGMVVG